MPLGWYVSVQNGYPDKEAHCQSFFRGGVASFTVGGLNNAAWTRTRSRMYDVQSVPSNYLQTRLSASLFSIPGARHLASPSWTCQFEKTNWERAPLKLFLTVWIDAQTQDRTRGSTDPQWQVSATLAQSLRFESSFWIHRLVKRGQFNRREWMFRGRRHGNVFRGILVNIHWMFLHCALLAVLGLVRALNHETRLRWLPNSSNFVDHPRRGKGYILISTKIYARLQRKAHRMFGSTTVYDGKRKADESNPLLNAAKRAKKEVRLFLVSDARLTAESLDP